MYNIASILERYRLTMPNRCPRREVSPRLELGIFRTEYVGSQHRTFHVQDGCSTMAAASLVSQKFRDLYIPSQARH